MPLLYDTELYANPLAAHACHACTCTIATIMHAHYLNDLHDHEPVISSIFVILPVQTIVYTYNVIYVQNRLHINWSECLLSMHEGTYIRIYRRYNVSGNLLYTIYTVIYKYTQVVSHILQLTCILIVLYIIVFLCHRNMFCLLYSMSTEHQRRFLIPFVLCFLRHSCGLYAAHCLHWNWASSACVPWAINNYKYVLHCACWNRHSNFRLAKSCNSVFVLKAIAQIFAENEVSHFWCPNSDTITLAQYHYTITLACSLDPLQGNVVRNILFALPVLLG